MRLILTELANIDIISYNGRFTFCQFNIDLDGDKLG
jgi:hypothetical protein